jgi:hypothetical protein
MAPMTRIEGASTDQHALLEELLAGIPNTQIAVLRVAPEYNLEPERDEDDKPLDPNWDPTTPLGDALVLVEPERPDFRTEWEFELVGAAFHRLSYERGLPQVVVVRSADVGTSFWHDESLRLEAQIREELEIAVQAAASTTGALLDRVEFLEVDGLAAAVSVAVPEAHGYLRHGLEAFAQLSRLSDFGLAGAFVEVVDGDPQPVHVMFRARPGAGFGTSSSRSDVRCCAPGGLSRAIDDSGPPPCPFPSRTWEDMWDAFRRDLPRVTGHDVSYWRNAIAGESLRNQWDRMRWLEQAGLGRAYAYAVVTSED